MIVIDASALAAYLLREPEAKDIKPYLSESLVSIALVVTETANAILMAGRRGRIDKESEKIIFTSLLEFQDIILFHSQINIIKEAFQIACAEEITIYDTLYIVLAKKVNATLLTLDQKQKALARKLNLKVIL